MNLIKRLFDIKNAFRVLDIMDECGCDIEEQETDRWKIIPKWYVSEEEAKDLRTIVLFRQQYRKRCRFWKIFFPNLTEGYRPSR